MASSHSDSQNVHVVTTHTAGSCSAALVEACAALMWETPEFAWAHNAVDGKVDRHPSETVARMMAEVKEVDNEIQSSLQWHTVWQDGELFACSKSFVRVVSHSDGAKMPVLALGNVACARAARGKGYVSFLQPVADLDLCSEPDSSPHVIAPIGARAVPRFGCQVRSGSGRGGAGEAARLRP